MLSRVRLLVVTLAEQGAQVLDLANPALEVGLFVQDTHVGFRSTFVDLKAEAILQPGRRPCLRRGRVVENYRGRKIGELGLSPETVAELRPGIIYASLRGFGWEGPWVDRGGFDMDANCATGFTALEGTADAQLPATVILNDYLADI